MFIMYPIQINQTMKSMLKLCINIFPVIIPVSKEIKAEKTGLLLVGIYLNNKRYFQNKSIKQKMIKRYYTKTFFKTTL